MANTITKTTIVNLGKHLVQLINIVGDGSGEETNTVLVDRSTFEPADGTEIIVDGIEGIAQGCNVALSFDATADLVFARLNDANWVCHDWKCFGGVSSAKAGAGANGDILVTTSSLGAGDAATFLLRMRKE